MTILLTPEAESEEQSNSDKKSKTPSQVLNFLWLNLELPAPADPADGSIRQPLPEKYIESVRKAGWVHSKAKINFWVDSQRLTKKQFDYLKEAVELGRPNVTLKDLRSIPAYDNEKLYNEAETNPHWRDDWGQKTTIWRQVDAAKILISLQGNYDQTFFADMDYAHMDIKSEEVQGMLKGAGLFIGSGSENQLWGFTRARKPFFEEYYKAALTTAYNGNNAWSLLLDRLQDFRWKENINGSTNLYINNDSTSAEQPGSELHDGYDKAKPAVIDSERLAHAFKKVHRSAIPALVHAKAATKFPACALRA